jgi:hypothetical protein
MEVPASFAAVPVPLATLRTSTVDASELNASGAAAPRAVAEQQREAKMIAVVRRAAGDLFWLVIGYPIWF